MSTTKPLSGDDLTLGSSGLTLTDGSFLANGIRYLNTCSSTYAITAIGTNQATAQSLNSVLNQIDTSTAGTGVNLPYSGGKHNTPYQFCIIYNNTANAVLVYGSNTGTDTINNVAGSTGQSLPAGATALFNSAKVGAWFSGDISDVGIFTAILDSGNLTFTTAGVGIVIKQGANGRTGQFTLTGTTAVTVSNTSISTTDIISISLSVVGGTVGAVPAIKTITSGTGFTVAGTVGDTSTYNYAATATTA